jgi:hypothetical protein
VSIFAFKACEKHEVAAIVDSAVLMNFRLDSGANIANNPFFFVGVVERR